MEQNTQISKTNVMDGHMHKGYSFSLKQESFQLCDDFTVCIASVISQDRQKYSDLSRLEGKHTIIPSLNVHTRIIVGSKDGGM